MSGLIFACITPHGSEIVPELAGDSPEQMAVTRTAMEELGQRLAELAPDTLVVITPHGVRVDGTVSIAVTERASGQLAENGSVISLDLAVDRPLALSIAKWSRELGVPVSLVGYGASGGPSSCLPLDWGALIPLWFLGGRSEHPPEVVVITPSRAVPLEQLHRFGQAVAQAAQQTGQRVALVASSDLAHAHDANGPYGYHPAAATFDRFVREVVESQDLDRLQALDPTFVEQAKPDGLWQIVMLAGSLGVVPMRGRVLSYEAPTYFGMLAAAYEPIDR